MTPAGTSEHAGRRWVHPVEAFRESWARDPLEALAGIGVALVGIAVVVAFSYFLYLNLTTKGLPVWSAVGLSALRAGLLGAALCALPVVVVAAVAIAAMIGAGVVIFGAPILAIDATTRGDWLVAVIAGCVTVVVLAAAGALGSGGGPEPDLSDLPRPVVAAGVVILSLIGAGLVVSQTPGLRP